MFDILQYPFFQKALAGVLIISVAAAIIGTYIATRRLVSISGGVTHACFGGLGLGYFLSINPVLMAALFAIGASLGVEWMSERHRMREDSAIAVVWALGMAIGVFFVFLSPGNVPELNGFLFGSVLTITSADLLAFNLFTIVLVAFFAWKFRQIVACAFDRDFARVVGMPVRFITLSMTVLTAVCIVLTIRLVGVMMLMSMLVMPQIISEIFCRRFKSIMLCSIGVSAACCLTGLMISAVVDVPCSALIVMVMVAVYVLARLLRRLTTTGHGPAIVAAIVLASGLTGCSLKKNTAATRQYTAFITRYNIYFNGNEHYRETLAEMEKDYADDYSRTLLMHPAEAYGDPKAPQPAGDFKRSIEKAQKAIQLRSIKKRPARKSGRSSDPEYKKWLKREEYNPFLHNAWLMMGRSQYMNGDFLGAAATFYYLAKHFTWLPATVTEAKLWQARSYIASDWLYEAESILSKIKQKDIEGNSTLLNLYNFGYADLYLRRHDYQKAIPYLIEAIKYAKGAQKIRLTFLLGQLYADTGQRRDAYNAFNRVGKMSGASHRTKFNARIKQSEVYEGTDIDREVKALRAMTRYGSNREYLDQIYYAIGNLYLSRADTLKALENYEKAVTLSTRNGIDKAHAQIALGKLYYDRRRYDKAQPCYAEAVPMLPETFPDYKLLKRRSDVLDELAVYSQNVELQDSLLRLAAMSPDEQRKVVNRIIDDLKKREREEAERAARDEYLQQQAAAGTGLQTPGAAATPATYGLNTDRSWYFYNEATRNAGRTEFQKRWGSRRLEDDWRRRNKNTFTPFGEESDNTSDLAMESDSLSTNPDGKAPDRETIEHAADPHYPEYYLRQIPSTDIEKATAREVIQEGLYNMGVILKDKMDDTEASEYEFNRLLERFPDNPYRLDAYYNMYLMYARAGNSDRAEKYRHLIMEQFPESRQAIALANPAYIEKLRRMPQVEQALYDEAYRAYMDNDNTRLHAIYHEMRRDYPMSRIMPKFMFLEALSYVTTNEPDKFSKILEELIVAYPDADVSPLASSYLSLLSKGRQLNSGGTNLRGMTWSTRLGSDSLASVFNKPADFDFETDGPFNVVFVYRTDRVDANRLLFDVARYNFSRYVVRDFDLEAMRFDRLGLLVVSGFNNQQEAVTYRTNLEREHTLQLPKGVVPLVISRRNFQLLLNEGRTLDEYFQAVGDTRLNQIHEQTLPSAEYPSAAEMYDQSPEPQPEPENRPKTEPQPQPQPKPEPEPQPQPQPQPESKPESKPEPEPEPEPEEYPYDIPVPTIPVGKPPVAPRIK